MVTNGLDGQRRVRQSHFYGGVPGKDRTLEMAQIVPNTEQGCGLPQLREV